ncbi:serine kinase of HPr protein (carbohydrate metabolism regulator) [Sphingomonas zeicaulis]|uniref:HPr kinase/phosphorylase n=1 Tax=Sphingomonas zeicaulis TaxID=1632740 RepID=UPI003D233560
MSEGNDGTEGGATETLHASCVAIGGHAVLIEGLSGTGKSDLALRLIDRGAALVSDDYTIVRRTAAGLRAFAPETIAGSIEVRGIGIVAMAHVEDVPVALIVGLGEPVARLPEEGLRRRIAGVAVPRVTLAGTEPSAPIKVELALAAVGEAE